MLYYFDNSGSPYIGEAWSREKNRESVKREDVKREKIREGVKREAWSREKSREAWSVKRE